MTLEPGIPTSVPVKVNRSKCTLGEGCLFLHRWRMLISSPTKARESCLQLGTETPPAINDQDVPVKI